MNKLKQKIKNLNYRHYIAIAITIIFLCMSIFIFPNAFVRIGEALRDVWNSICYYIQEILYFDWGISPTVTSASNVPFTPFFNLPATWEDFVVKWNEYWSVWTTADNFQAYMSYLGTLLFNFSRILLLIILPMFLILYLLFQRYLRAENNDYNIDSKPLKFTKWLATKTYIPIKSWLKGFVNFIREHKRYYQIWLFIWAFNFNLITIVIEFVAFYLFFVVSFDVGTIYTQFYKLFIDISVPLAFIPPFAWVILTYLFICWLRKKIGYSRLQHFENKNCGMINERPIVLMLCGTMGKNKTTIITDMALSQEVMLRDKAFELILKNDMKFPYFPWVNLENDLKCAIDDHVIYNLATIKTYIRNKRQTWEDDNSRVNIFDYDYMRYGLTYNDNLTITNIWKVIENYAQLYFVYILQCSLIISNYSIRTDNALNDIGNFPMWDTDFFKRNPELMEAQSRHAHILDFDSLRLGRKIIEDNYKKDSFEFGVINITEVGKERKNNLTLQEIKVKEAFANQKNDGFNDMLKMIRHNATIDNFPFVKIITDEQRPESWGADARDLLEVVTVDEVSDKKLAMPFFALTDLIHDWVFNKFVDLYYRYRFTRSDNTLFMYFVKKFVAWFHHFHERIYNTFGYKCAGTQVENGTMDGKILERKYYIMSKKIYSRRFSTDCFSDFFTEKALRSPIGINDLEEYATEKATFAELQQQNSYFINDLMNKHQIDENKEK